jgi:formate hydrogenlyase subunit 3/multisubunit Na+/H+ antiporter MnhD subunit
VCLIRDGCDAKGTFRGARLAGPLRVAPAGWLNAGRADFARRTAVLTAVAGGVAFLLLLGGLAASPFGRGRPATAVVRAGCAIAAAGLVGLGLAVLAAGEAPDALVLPLGPIRGRAGLALDGLSAWFLLPAGVAGAASGLAALSAPPRGEAPLPLLLAGFALCFAAADGAAMLCGLGLVLLAAAARSDGAAGPTALAAAGLACLGAAFGLLGGAATDFATLRTLPPEGWRAAALPFLVLAGAGAVAAAGLPLPSRRRPTVSAEEPLLAAALPMAAVYVLARLLPDLGGPAQPSWWGLPLLAGGGAGAAAAALRGLSAEDLEGVPACAGASAAGLAVTALGASLLFRGADLGTLAALAAGGALLLALGAGLAVAALAVLSAAVARSAGSARLDRLGGLARFMPVSAAAALVAVATLAFLPTLPGFAGLWALLQALVAGWRLGGAVLPLFCAGALVLAGAAAAIGAAAMLRVFAATFLGRPRTPRGAGAREVAGVLRWAVLLPVCLLLPIGLLPGWALAAGGPALAVLAGRAPMPTRGAGLALAEGGAAYAPLLLAALLAALALVLAALVMRLAPEAGAPARGPAWDGGFLAPPPHLPFGDPLTQPSPAGLAEPLRRLLPSPRRRAAWRLPRRDGRFEARTRSATTDAAMGAGLLILAAALAAFAMAWAG